MKFLFIGLGNPGIEYENSRHNIGFAILDEVVRKKEVQFEPGRYAHIAEFKDRGKISILIKPQTFMNLSGKAVRFWMQEYNIPLERILVIADDLSLPFGKIRIRKKGSAGGHNGLKNIEETLQSKDYPRMRIGIGNDFQSGSQVNYVLEDFKEEEKLQLLNTVNTAVEIVFGFSRHNLDTLMNKFNSKI